MDEFRQDLVSGEWILFATGRSKRPGSSVDTVQARREQPIEQCPFEDPEKFGNEVLATYPASNGSGWFAKVAKNKFPAVLKNDLNPSQTTGPHDVADAVGLHELVIYRGHYRDFHEFGLPELATVLKIYQQRYKAMTEFAPVRYILIFHNRGPGAGASVAHPHSQIMAIPLVPPEMERNLNGAAKYFSSNKKNPFEALVEWEKSERKRVVFENDEFIAVCPFASRYPYEVRIFSQKPHAHFENCPEDILDELAEVLSVVLKKIVAGLADPDYNFYIHTAPIDKAGQQKHDYYSWHIEILPKVKTDAGFELGSGIEINTVDPDEAAEVLRKTQI